MTSRYSVTKIKYSMTLSIENQVDITIGLTLSINNNKSNKHIEILHWQSRIQVILAYNPK